LPTAVQSLLLVPFVGGDVGMPANFPLLSNGYIFVGEFTTMPDVLLSATMWTMFDFAVSLLRFASSHCTPASAMPYASVLRFSLMPAVVDSLPTSSRMLAPARMSTVMTATVRSA
jgi:hypothetical protein